MGYVATSGEARYRTLAFQPMRVRAAFCVSFLQTSRATSTEVQQIQKVFEMTCFQGLPQKPNFEKSLSLEVAAGPLTPHNAELNGKGKALIKHPDCVALFL